MKAMTCYKMTNSHASDTCWEDGDCETTFYLKLHICSYLICAKVEDRRPEVNEAAVDGDNRS